MKTFLLTALLGCYSLFTFGQLSPSEVFDKDHTVDYLVVYDRSNPAFIEARGGREAYAQEVVDSINSVLRNSKLDYRFRVAGVHYLEEYKAANIEAGLQYLSNDDKIKEIRKKTKADIVVLLTETFGDINSGLADHKDNAIHTDAYSCVNLSMAASAYTAAHEAGHILGGYHSRHDYEPAPSTHEWAAAYASPKGYRTVLCSMAPGTTVPIFSGPESVWNGEQMGDEKHDNVRIIKHNLPRVVQFGEHLEPEMYYASETEITFNKDAQSHQVTFYANSFFMVRPTADWIKLTHPNNYFNTVELETPFTIDANNTGAERTAYIEIFNCDYPQNAIKVKITQTATTTNDTIPPVVEKVEEVWSKGITKEQGWVASSFASEGYTWAGSIANLMEWWGTQTQHQLISDYNAASKSTDIYKEIAASFSKQEADATSALKWYVSGHYSVNALPQLYSHQYGGVYREMPNMQNLIYTFSHHYNNNEAEGIKKRPIDFSKELNQKLKAGHGCIIRTLRGCINCWGIGFDSESGLIKKIWLTDPSGKLAPANSMQEFKVGLTEASSTGNSELVLLNAEGLPLNIGLKDFTAFSTDISTLFTDTEILQKSLLQELDKFSPYSADYVGGISLLHLIELQEAVKTVKDLTSFNKYQQLLKSFQTPVKDETYYRIIGADNNRVLTWNRSKQQLTCQSLQTDEMGQFWKVTLTETNPHKSNRTVRFSISPKNDPKKTLFIDTEGKVILESADNTGTLPLCLTATGHAHYNIGGFSTDNSERQESKYLEDNNGQLSTTPFVNQTSTLWCLKKVSDAEVTGIQSAATGKTEGPVFDLYGRKASTLKKGQIYIKGGHVFLK